MGFKEDLEKGAVGVNGDVKLPLLRKEHGKEYYRRSHKKGKGKSSEAFQGSVATALFCTAVVAMGPLQFGFCVSSLCLSGIHLFIWVKLYKPISVPIWFVMVLYTVLCAEINYKVLM